MKFTFIFLPITALLASCGLKVSIATQWTRDLTLATKSETKLALMTEDITYAKSFVDSNEFEVAEELLIALRKKIVDTERCGSYASLLVRDLNFDISDLLADIYTARGERDRAQNMHIEKVQNNNQFPRESASCFQDSSEYYFSHTDWVLPTLQHFAVQQLLNQK